MFFFRKHKNVFETRASSRKAACDGIDNLIVPRVTSGMFGKIPDVVTGAMGVATVRRCADNSPLQNN
jgi:hypothetical protein